LPDDDAPDATGPAGADEGEREGVAPVAAEPAASVAEPVPVEPSSPGVAAVEVLEPPPAGSAAEAYERRARLAEDRLAEVLAAYRKLKVDNDAYRGRLTKNIDRRYEQRRERLLLKFIDILDNLDRALEAAETSYTGEPMIEGLILVRTQLLQTLQDEGLERIPVLGLPYDPATSEAVQTQAVDDPEHHHVVVKELMRGYRLNSRIARAARVVVGEHHPEAKGEAAIPAPLAAAPAGEAPPVVAAIAVTAQEPVRPPRGRSRRRAAEAAFEASGAGDTESDAEEAEPTLEEIIARAEAQEAKAPEFSPVDADAPVPDEAPEAVEAPVAAREDEEKTPDDEG
jgi:molecular chaperone GrpE